jgi:hypothetical protein
MDQASVSIDLCNSINIVEGLELSISILGVESGISGECSVELEFWPGSKGFLGMVLVVLVFGGQGGNSD